MVELKPRDPEKVDPESLVNQDSGSNTPGDEPLVPGPGPNTIGFTSPFDASDPLQWPQRKKLAIVINIALLSAVGQMASSMVAPAVEHVMLEFHTTSLLLGVLVVSVFMLGQCVGLMTTSGLSDVYGRVVVIHVTNALFVVFAVAAAVARDLGMLIGFRFLLGMAASAPPSIGGGIIADLFESEERGFATSIYGFGLLLGPMVGPIAGGYVTGALGWRWVCWLIAIVVCLFVSWRENPGT